MWISKMLSKQSSDERAEKGEVTISSPSVFEADASQTVRNIDSYTPYGYSAGIPVGEEVLLLPSFDGTVALGTKTDAAQVSAGEVVIRSLGGASIALKNDGTVVINGRLFIDQRGNIST